MGDRMNAKTMHEMARKNRIRATYLRKLALFHNAAPAPLYMADHLTARKLIQMREERKRQRRLAQGLELIGSTPSGILPGEANIVRAPSGHVIFAAGRYHADAIIVRPPTGRMSTSQPEMQRIPPPRTVEGDELREILGTERAMQISLGNCSYEENETRIIADYLKHPERYRK